MQISMENITKDKTNIIPRSMDTTNGESA